MYLNAVSTVGRHLQTVDGDMSVVLQREYVPQQKYGDVQTQIGAHGFIRISECIFQSPYLLHSY